MISHELPGIHSFTSQYYTTCAAKDPKYNMMVFIKHRLLWLYLQNETNFFTAPKKVLHFAPEQEFYKRFKKQSNLDYTTTDLY